MTLDHVPGAVKASADVLSVGVIAGALAQALPHIAAILSIVWTLIRLYETDTVQGMIRRSPRTTAPAAEVVIDQEKHGG